MLNKQNELNFSPYADLYDKLIPKNHMFRKINEMVDFSFILTELENKYCLNNGLLHKTEAMPVVPNLPAVKEKLNLLKETMEDTKEELNKSKDEDAKIGHKTKDSSFFGYKTHIAMTPEKIICAATVTSGEKPDEPELPELVRKSRKAGIKVENVIADAAYSGKKNQGCNQSLTYYFDVKKCQKCPFRDGCYKEGAKSKTYSITLKSEEHKKQKEFQETEYFKLMAKERYKIEAKNSELKNVHGYDVSVGNGLYGTKIQGACTIFVSNLKRILLLLENR